VSSGSYNRFRGCPVGSAVILWVQGSYSEMRGSRGGFGCQARQSRLRQWNELGSKCGGGGGQRSSRVRHAQVGQAKVSEVWGQMRGSEVRVRCGRVQGQMEVRLCQPPVIDALCFPTRTVGNYEKAVECSRTFLLFRPEDGSIRQNLEYYRSKLPAERADEILPREVGQPPSIFNSLTGCGYCWLGPAFNPHPSLPLEKVLASCCLVL